MDSLLAKRVLPWTVVAVAVVAPWALVARSLANDRPPAATMKPTAIIWAGKVFSSQRALAGWLSAHGTPYADWVRQHPQAEATIEAPAQTGHAPPRAVSVGESGLASAPEGGSGAPAGTSATTAASTTAAAALVTTPAAAQEATGGGADTGTEILMLLLGCLAAAAGIFLPVLARRLRPNWRPAPFEVRLAAVAAGMSLSLAAVIAGSLG